MTSRSALEAIIEPDNKVPKITDPPPVLAKSYPSLPDTVALDQLTWSPHAGRQAGPGSQVSRPSSPRRREVVDIAQSIFSPRMNWYRVVSACLTCFGNGLNDSAPGALIPNYNIGYAIVSLIFVSNALGFLIAAPFTEALQARLGRAKALMISEALMLVGYFAIIFTPPYSVVVISYVQKNPLNYPSQPPACELTQSDGNRFFLVGLGMAINLALNNVFISNLANSTSMLGLFHGSYGIGGTIGPLIATAIASHSTAAHWSRYYFLSLVVTVINIFFAGWAFWDYEKDAASEPSLLLGRRSSDEQHPATRKQLLRQSLHNKTTLLGALFIFAYQGAEVSISGWITSFLISYRDGKPAEVGYVTAGFWAGITIGRFVLTHPAHRNLSGAAAMKFGRNLQRNQVPEWSSAYINYKSLKKLIKTTAEATEHGQDADLAEFFFSLDRNLEDVGSFFNKKLHDSSRRLKLLQDRYGKSAELPEGLGGDELEDLVGALLELRGQVRKLHWYGDVNRRGFIKITKKLDKKLLGVSAQRQYLESKVNPQPFASSAGLSDAMKTINDWLSALGDANPKADDVSSVHSTHSLSRASSKATLGLPAGLLDAVVLSVRNDDAAVLAKLLMELGCLAEDEDSSVPQVLLLNLLQRSISCRSRKSIDLLLGKLHSLDEADDINQRNCIHRLVIAIGRMGATPAAILPDRLRPQASSEPLNYIIPATSPMLAPPLCTSTEQDWASFLGTNDELVKLLQYLLNKLRPHQRAALQARDSYGRMPLHYAAQFGFIVICQVIIKQMQVWGQFDVSDGIDSPAWQDTEGWAPLHLSVIGGHPLTTKTLLEAENWRGESVHKVDLRKTVSKSSAVLALATKANSVAIVKLLVAAGVDINYQDESGETALHVAARFGHIDCAKILLEGSDYQKAETELTEKTFAWTPLFIACVDGHLGVVEVLIDAGADLERPDLSGWTAKEHAALRGHIDITKKLDFMAPEASDSSETSTIASYSPPFGSSLEDRTSHLLAHGVGSPRTSEPVKTFGHRYLTNDSMVLVSLGTMDMRKDIGAVKLDRIPFTKAHLTQLDTALSLVVSATGARGEPTVIDLPVQENICTEPISFMTPDASKVRILFDIIPTYSGSKDQIVGRAVAMLSSVKPNIGTKRATLQGDISVPIMSANTLDVIGSVNFSVLIITPFSHPNMSITENQTYWKKMSSTMVIGHRGDLLCFSCSFASSNKFEGLGKNLASRKSLQLGENTIESFIAAANLGASYVEGLTLSGSRLTTPDVQLTKDHVPVIYHDFLVSETGIDAPVHSLTLEQFLHVSDEQTPRSSRATSPDRFGGGASTRRARSLSVGVPPKGSAANMQERMKHTRDFKMNGFKANSRGNFIQAPFTTLEELFKKLPDWVGFNIEMKYPMLHESEEHEMDTYAVELNSFVDTVLTKVYDLGKKRNIIFSSFNPDVCLLLSLKQPSIPILFLTEAGTCATGDIRASSLQEAIKFASRWDLLGIVSTAEPLVICPRLVKAVKESGLVCVSYGLINNDPTNVQLQVREGIDAVIVDNVLAIRKGLTEGSRADTRRTGPMAALGNGAIAT
ncbi:MAG: Glycerophosphocholine phosphodiesterase [Geoglossum umbratile]|nr:MAG: Glycerophosphocholine phosphodiesterase [Geoglossum umbratile]